MLNNSFDFASWHLNIGWATSASRGISRRWAFGGFAYYFWAPDGVAVVHIPLWILVALFATYPTIAFIRGPLRPYHRLLRIFTTKIVPQSTVWFCIGSFYVLIGVYGLYLTAWTAMHPLLLPLPIVLWLIPLVGVLTLFMGVMIVRLGLSLRKRERPSNCSRCGYDLTGNVSGVCPECGTKIQP